MRKTLVIALAALMGAMLTGCFAGDTQPQPTQLPAQTEGRRGGITFGTDRLNQPDLEIRVYDVATEKVLTMPLEEYLPGVLAGEMPNDWPLEALKAQAILARTFVYKFIDEKDSKYDGADISTDITEAQAYSAERVNDVIRRAVRETAGEVMVYDGALPYAWFYSHGGGSTALAGESLDFGGDEPGYTHVTDSRDGGAPDSVQRWEAEFTSAELAEAAGEAGLEVSAIESVVIGETGPSGRAVTLLINGSEVSAPTLRIALGSEEMRSTLLTECEYSGGVLRLAGRGYGHGVGMSQWGARELADAGMTAEEIVKYYFRGVEIEEI